jgi:hypothetical protein
MRPGSPGTPSATAASARVRWQPHDIPFREQAEQVLCDVLHELGLGGIVHELHVFVDLGNRDDHAYIEWNTNDHRVVRLFFAVGNFVTRDRRRAWARTWGRRAGLPPLAPRHFSRRSFAEACLHEFLHLRDDHDAGVDLSGHSEVDREALNELWNVWIDGRLNRRGLPAMSRAERRRIYRRTLGTLARFASRGDRVFQALWAADHLGPRELCAYLRELGADSAPRPRRRRQSP